MADYKILKRLERIIYLINNKTGITKQQLKDAIFEQLDYDVSDRTIERDFTTLATDYGLDIIYDRNIRGYRLQEDEERLAAFFKYAELSSLVELYEVGLKDYKTFQKWVIPDDSASFKGLFNMKSILKGITMERKLQFDKVNYYHQTEKQYSVTPLRLKEYLNRWYLIAVPDGLKEIRTFGIDRIKNLKVLNKKSETIKNINEQLKQFADVVGLNYSETEQIETVILSVHNKQLKYLRSLKLHHSQICIDGETDEQWGKVTYQLKPNYEFLSEILKLGAMVKVEQPTWFREKVKAEINSMNELYK